MPNKNIERIGKICYGKILILILIGRLFLGNTISLWLLSFVLIAISKFSSHKQLREVVIIYMALAPLSRERR